MDSEEFLVGHSYRLVGWPESVKIATLLYKGRNEDGTSSLLGVIRFRSPVDDNEIEYAESADWDDNGKFYIQDGPSKLDLGSVIGPYYPQWSSKRAEDVQELIRTAHNYLKWCEKAIGAGPVGNPYTHTWHNDQIRQSIKALVGDQ